MIPHHILSKLDTYEVEIHGLKLKVTIADDPTMVQQIISQLNSGDLIGLDIKGLNGDGFARFIPKMLVLFSGSRCLIVPNLQEMLSNKTEHKTISSLKQFFANPRLCFVGFNLYLERRLQSNPSLEAMLSKKGVELGELAARVLKKRELESRPLHDIAGEVGLDIKSLSGATPVSFFARVFSGEEIKHLIHNASASYLIGKKLLGML